MSIDDTSDTITIQLSQHGKHRGKYTTTIDAIDADLSEMHWHARPSHGSYDLYYAQTRIYHSNGTSHQESLHRIILERILGRKLIKGEQCDHIDGDTSNNRRNNLRLANHQQNNCNKRIRADSDTGLKGVLFDKRRNRYWSLITVNKKRIWLGYFDTPEEAHEAYCKAAEKYHGDFARFE